MDSMSITIGCFTLSNAIAKTSLTLRSFIREVRESRSELTALSSELHSLDGVLDLLKDDGTGFPPHLGLRLPVVLDHCSTIVNEIGGYVTILSDVQLSRQDKKFRWIATRKHMAGLRQTLEGYKATLGLALDLVGLVPPPRGNTSINHINRARDVSEKLASDPDFRSEARGVVAEMNQLSARFESESQRNAAILGLQAYVHALQAYADGVGLKFDLGHQLDGSNKSASSVGDGPDSAIEMNDDVAATTGGQGSTSQTSWKDASLPIEDIEGLLDELNDSVPSRPPTPPPRAARRTSIRSGSLGSISGSVSGSVSGSASGSGASPAEARFPAPAEAEYPPPIRTSVFNNSIRPTTATGRSIRSASVSASASVSNQPNATDSLYTFVTKISSDNDLSSSGPAAAAPIAPASPTSVASPLSKSGSRRMGLFGHKRGKPSLSSESSDAPGETATTATTATTRPSTASSVTRRGSQRFSVAFKRIPLFRVADDDEDEADEAAEGGAGAGAVFGVSLRKSIAVARGTAKTHHGGGNSGGSSRRDFPLCVLKCVSFLRDEGGVEAPNIFGEAGDPERVRMLRAVFSAAPTYGEDADLRDFGVHEAADVVLAFLAELPKPLVAESVARRWISLSKQATLPGSLATRPLDQCIDFWEEALGGMRGGAPARSLFKLLLNLWGDIADAADRNDMTAERLAGRLVKPLLHTAPGRYDTDFMLGLAFLIRKRSEYNMLLRGGTRKSNAAF